MLRNYITIALRVLLRQKIYSFINVSGLAIGIAATLLIAVYIADELSYDRFHKDADRIFRLVGMGRQNGVETSTAKVGSLWAEALQQEFPEVESVIRLNNVALASQSLLDIHLDSHLTNQEFETNGSRRYLYILGITALFIVILACINFVNLATARAAYRAKEVGIRKTVGAIRSRLAKQFMIESFIYCSLSVLLAMGLISMTLGLFNSLTSREFAFSDFGSPSFLLSTIGLLLMITAFAGTYPAFYLTSFKPSQVLKGRFGSISKGAGTRNALVIFQFVISASLIISSLVIRKQIKFMTTHDPGFDRSNVVCISNALSLSGNLMAFKNELQAREGIVGVSYSSRLPSQKFNQSGGYRRFGSEQWQTLYYNWADVDHARVLGFQVLDGRFFSDQFPSDSTSVVINQAAADLMGIQDLATKEYVEFGNDKAQHEIVGIIDNFNFESLQTGVNPMIMYFPDPFFLSKAAIRIDGNDLQGEIELIKTVWAKHSSAPFEYTFLDENMAAQYKSEELLGRITMVFTSLAIIIACVGLLGLVTYITNQRTKEIGIRKVMGAGVTQIITLISRDFVRLIIIALVIAIPLTWYATNKWLEGFAYHIDFSLVLAGISGGIVLLIAILTISFQSMKAALGNPVDSLRNE